MLSYEALMAEANQRNMPAGKIRGILREYLQVLILKAFYKHPESKKMYFTGGTALRLIHLTKRFSEDLDFNIAKLNKGEFEQLLTRVSDDLKKEGFAAAVSFFHRDKFLIAEIVFPDVEKQYAIESKYTKLKGIMIKVEAYAPKWKIHSETHLISGFGQMCPVVCTQKGASFANKIDALIHKNRARHLFDIMFMLSQHYPIDKNVFKKLCVQGPPMVAILNRVDGFSLQELKKQAEQLRPFLFDESEADLIVNAHTIIPELVKRYRDQTP